MIRGQHSTILSNSEGLYFHEIVILKNYLSKTKKSQAPKKKECYKNVQYNKNIKNKMKRQAIGWEYIFTTLISTWQ